MGYYLNPGNGDFEEAVNSRIYVDKSMLIEHTNSVLKTKDKHICVSRPRRFGKSMAADMLVAYYCKDCDSHSLFDYLKIAQTDDYEKHINKYNVFHFDMQSIATKAKKLSEIPDILENIIVNEIKSEYKDIDFLHYTTSYELLKMVYTLTKVPFVFVIDEWDCIYRAYNASSEEIKGYLDYLCMILKGQSYVALNYATGILPVKKYGKHSSLNMYNEYSMADQEMFAEFTGFTEKEVENLCKKYSMSLDNMKSWYDGYKVGDEDIYSPRSVVRSLESKKFSNYWTKTETFEALKDFIVLNFDDLKPQIIRMMGGDKIKVDTNSFQNDMVNFNCADDVLTLLIHLGYLTYDFDTKLAWIPNHEVMQEFVTSVKSLKWDEVVKSIQLSDELLEATMNKDSNRVAEIIEAVHQENTSILKYNDENSLACVISLAYYSARNKYEIFRELPSGKGFADLTFIPRKGVASPAIVVELKYNKSAETAIEQIKQKNYTEKLSAFSGDIILVGINYDDTKGHSCVIEKVNK